MASKPPTKTRKVAVMPDGARHPIKKSSQGWGHIPGTDMHATFGAWASHQDSVIDSVHRAGGRIETEPNPEFQQWADRQAKKLRLPVFEDLMTPLGRKSRR